MRHFGRDNRASVAVLFVAMAVALVGMVGVAVEYGRILLYQARLDAALDAAALAATQQIKASFDAGDSGGAISAATSLATGVFESNLGSTKALLDASLSVSFSQSGTTWTAAASYTAQVPSNFTSFANFYPVARRTTSAITLAEYQNFYLLLDVSASMGLPSTDQGQAALAAINPDEREFYPSGCVFACHYPGFSGYDLSRNGGNPSNPSVSYCPQPDTSACIQLRVDAVASAVQQLALTAQSTAVRPDQFAIGLYPFIVDVIEYVPPTTDLASVSSRAASLTSLLDKGSNGDLAAGGTHFENALPNMFLYLKLGDGSSRNSPKPVLFLVTDGAQNDQILLGRAFNGFNQARTLDESFCRNFKIHGVTVAVLYIPYRPIQNPTTFSASEDFVANANIPFIPQHLQACASPGLFFTADRPADIANAMQTMFKQSVQSPRLTK